ncbi:MAG: protein translocase subunit SecD [Phycisphaerae bacterium]
MNERDLWWKTTIVGALVALAFASVWPLDQKLKFGIDLYGGYTLLYEIDDTGLDPRARADLSKNVMAVLKERVDPKGVFNLVWRPVGHNRLEIQMPRPSKDVALARSGYEQLQEEIRSTIIRRSDVVAKVSAPPEQRKAVFASLADGIQSRVPLLDAAAKAYDDLQAMRKAYEERVAQIQRDNLTEDEIRQAVQLPPDQRPAAFQAMLRGIPARKELLEAAARAWDAYRAAPAASQPVTAPASQPASQPADAAALKAAFESAIRKVLAANVNPDDLTEGATLDEVIRLEEVFEEAVGKVVDTNIDIGRLQSLLDMKPKDKKRKEGLAELYKQYPGLTDLFDRLVQVTAELQKRRKGEGRLEDPADLQRLLKGAGVLEFRILPENDRTNPIFETYRETLKKRGPRPQPGEENYQWFEIEDPAEFTRLKDKLETEFDQRKNNLGVVVERYGDKYYVLAHIAEGYTMTHTSAPGEKDWSLKAARFQRDQNGLPAIGFTLDQVGGSKFGVLTRRHKGKQLCIFLDDKAISNATIQSVITTNGQITGTFTPQEVRDTVKKLNAGSLPRKVKDPPISIRSIGPSLGAANRAAGLAAAKYAAICVGIFMLIYYFYAGTIAVIAVGFNILFIGAMMSTLGATLTLPGIAGLVLAVGMAVDANVLINERIREELARGTAMRMAIKLGYERAFSAILDSNVTTVLTCVILYMVGSEEVKGFGLTLGIGVFINIFTAYFVTRMFFDLMVMRSVPTEVKRYPVYTAVSVAAFGALLYGLGYWINDAEARETAVSMAFGRSIMDIGPAILGLMVLMFLARAVHHGRTTLPMLHLIGSPKINWVGKRYVFFGLSGVLIVLSIIGFVSLDRSKLYDIEFLGGVNAQIDLKHPGELDQTDISERLEKSAETLERFADAVAGAEIVGREGLYTIETPGVTAARLEPFLKVVLGKELSQVSGISYEDPGSQRVTIQLRERTPQGEEAEERPAFDPVEAKTRLARRMREAAASIRDANVQAISGLDAGGEEGASFAIVTREPSKEIVVDAIMENLKSDLDIKPALTFKLLDNQDLGGVPYFPIRDENPKALGFELTESQAAAIDLKDWQGGVAIVLDEVKPAQRIEVLQERLRQMRLQPGFEKYGWRQSKVFGLVPAPGEHDLYTRLVVLVTDENYPIEDDQGSLSATWQSNLAEPEVELLRSALQRQTSLKQVTQFDKQVSGEAQVQAYLALALSWFLIIGYVWFRFGNIRWGLAAVIALIHDVTIAIGCVAGTYYLATHIPWLGSLLMIDQGFRIDLAMVAALLTVIGYSVNDTIVVFDRIRENRGRQTEVTPDIVNTSISQTLSRTLLTFLTSLISVLIMYIFGGRGIHSFSFVLIIGLSIGTYSSIGIASQFLLRRSQLKPA